LSGPCPGPAPPVPGDLGDRRHHGCLNPPVPGPAIRVAEY
jgi:hypothetical protein